MTNSEKNIMKYVQFKLSQLCNITGFGYKMEDVNEELAKMVRQNKVSWIKEAIQAGV